MKKIIEKVNYVYSNSSQILIRRKVNPMKGLLKSFGR